MCRAVALPFRLQRWRSPTADARRKLCGAPQRDAASLARCGGPCGRFPPVRLWASWRAVPPYSPDLNPIENAWALLDRRLAATQPGGWEGEKSFRRRVRNAVHWLNANRSDELGNMVASMPKRIKMCAERKGAMTEY